MKKYRITFVNKFYSQYVTEVNAESETEAISEAKKLFEQEYPCYRHCYKLLMCSQLLYEVNT